MRPVSLLILRLPRSTISDVANVGNRMTSKLSTRNRAVCLCSSGDEVLHPDTHSAELISEVSVFGGACPGRQTFDSDEEEETRKKIRFK